MLASNVGFRIHTLPSLAACVSVSASLVDSTVQFSCRNTVNRGDNLPLLTRFEPPHSEFTADQAKGERDCRFNTVAPETAD